MLWIYDVFEPDTMQRMLFPFFYNMYIVTSPNPEIVYYEI